MTSDQKRGMLRYCWKPESSYDFRQDSIGSNRSFIHDWLNMYKPWLTYSRKLKGALCIHCTLFPPATVKGILGAFVVAPFTKYKHMHQCCKTHENSQYHKNSIQAAKDFMDSVPVDVAILSGHQQLIAKNRKILSSIISTIMFCGTHDIAVRGHTKKSGKLRNFRNSYLLIIFLSI